MQNNNWLDREAYPFTSRFLELDAGRMHYIDEGQGDAIVLVHGTPTWSFLYRNLIKELSKNHRCIAMDHIGFGLSDKPVGWTYRPQDHARNVQALIDHLVNQCSMHVVHFETVPGQNVLQCCHLLPIALLSCCDHSRNSD